jgi:hypothetical protein
MCSALPERRPRLPRHAWVFVLVVGLPGLAGAWQPPARSVLRRAAAALASPEAREGPMEVALVGRARASSGDGTSSLAVRWVFDRATRGAAAAWRDERGKPTTWRRGDPVPTVGATGPSAAEFTLLPRLFADADPAGLALALGVDGERRHLALLGERVADVLGAERGARDTPAALARPRDAPSPPGGLPRGPTARWWTLELLDWAGPHFPRRIVVRDGVRWVRTYESEPPRFRGRP